MSQQKVDAVVALQQLASLLHLHGNDEQANQIHRRVQIYSALPEVPPKTAVLQALPSLSSLAEMHASQNHFEEAIRITEKLIQAEEVRSGHSSPSLAPHLVQLASYYERVGREREATILRDRAGNLLYRA